MSFQIWTNKDIIATLNQNWKKFLLWGTALVILGTLAIIFSAFTTLVTVVFLGILLFAAGAVIIIDTFQFWWGKWKGFALHMIMGLLYLSIGYMFMTGPVISSISLTMLLGIFITIIGLFRIYYALTMRLLQWGWPLFNGIISFLLGLMIIAGWPATGMFIIGLFVGIDLLFAGWAYIMLGLSAKKMTLK